MKLCFFFQSAPSSRVSDWVTKGACRPSQKEKFPWPGQTSYGYSVIIFVHVGCFADALRLDTVSTGCYHFY